MAYEWPNYDPTLQALLHPEQSHPYGLHNAGDGWPLEAICAEFARLAYFQFETPEGKARLTQALAKAGFGPPEPFNSDVARFGNPLRRALQALRNRDAQAFGATSDDGKLTIVAFRGTQANRPRDLLTDLFAWPSRQERAGGKVHKGFWLAYLSLEEAIDRWLARVGHQRLVVTGHSLGAAMATVMAAVRKEAELVTFGSPLTGNREFAETFRERTLAGKALRYVDCSDEVTTVPYGFLGYRHCGELRYIDRNGVVHSPPPEEAAMAQDRKKAKDEYRSIHAGRPGNVPVRNFADHTPVNYVSALSGKRAAAAAGIAAAH